MDINKLKLVLVSKLLGNGIGTFYKTHIYNCNPKNYLKTGRHVQLFRPLYVFPRLIELGDFTRIQHSVRTVISENQKIVIKKYSAVGANVTIIPGNHIPTVSLPQYLSYMRINDVNNTLVIEEDAWIGANSTLLYKGSVGRGAVVGAGSLVTKKVPPYAVVSGIPARIIAVRFSLEQILEHEKHLYPTEDRLSKEYLEELFSTEYVGKRIIGTASIAPDVQEAILREREKIGMYDYNMSE